MARLAAKGWLAILLLAAALSAHAADYLVAPPPAWANAISPDRLAAEAPLDTISGGAYYLLSDQQVRLSPSGAVRYRHIAQQAITEKGIDAVAHVEVRFDPSWSHLTLHSIDIVRAGRIIPKLADAKVQMLQREEALEYRIFDGSKTANVFLDDVRVGDIVSYSYSIEGSNPVFAGREFGSALLQYADPLARLRLRLLTPVQRPVAITLRNTEQQASEREDGGYKIREWNATALVPLREEKDVPGWYDRRPTVQWSEYADWGAVAAWAAPRYRVPTHPAPPLQAEIDRIAAAHADAEGRLLAALRFVQEQIRYLGVEVGAGSHAPNAPDRVLARRFGDCKDKALLTVTLLAGLGIDARVALVDTDAERGVAQMQPSPGAFDHVVVRARLGGHDYWIDPTRSPQNGDLAHLTRADYGMALVVDPATRELASMNDPSAPASSKQVRVLMDSSAGFDRPMQYTITTLFEGNRADATRWMLATTGMEKTQQQYLNFYARYYPGITTSRPLEVTEDAVANRVTTVEHYLVPDFWGQADSDKRQADLYAPDVDEVLSAPSEVARHSPLQVAHPIVVQQRTEVLLPETWSIKTESFVVENPAFRFERKKTGGEVKKLVLEDRYESRTDEVAAADVARYAADLDRARDATGYQLTWTPAAEATQGSALERFNWPIAAIALLMVLVWGALALAIYRRDPAQPSLPIDPSLRGIRGWLFLPALGAIVSPLRIARDMYSMFGAFSVDVWAQHTIHGSESFHPMWAPLLLGELVLNLGLLVFSLLLVVMFFQKRRAVPKLYVAFLFAAVAVSAMDLAAAALVPDLSVTTEEWIAIWRQAFSAVLWSAYFLTSRRVRSTFIETRRSVESTVVPSALAAQTQT